MPPKVSDAVGLAASDENLCNDYINSLSELEQRVCGIARDHLKSSFDLSRSSGFIIWKKNNT